MQRCGQLASRGPALPILARDAFDRALGQLLEVVLDVADGSSQSARQSMLGRQSDLGDLLQLRDEVAFGFGGETADLRDGMRFAPGDELVGRCEQLPGIDLESR